MHQVDPLNSAEAVAPHLADYSLKDKSDRCQVRLLKVQNFFYQVLA
jgi:hypothetical protein